MEYMRMCGGVSVVAEIILKLLKRFDFFKNSSE